jgi:RHS repeat-associated protein
VNTDGTVDETQNNGQIARIEGSIGTQKQWQQRFSYDSLGRLSQASEYRGDNFQQSSLLNYSYDPYGNRYQSHSSNPQALACTAVEDSDINKLTNRYTSDITYDAAGNLTVDGKFRHRQYGYYANGRQRWTARLDGTDAATSVYDGAGQRVASMANGVLSVMVYDASGKLVAEYGTPSSQTGGTQYVFADHQGSTRVTLNQAGGVIARHDYQPFGEEIYAGTGLRSTTQGYDQSESVRQKYAGMERDESSGLSHTLWRKYDGISGRWTTPDPYGGSMTVGDPQSFNRYSYVNNDPVNLVDLLGLMLSDIGIYQTTNERVARGLAYQCVLNLRQSVSQGNGGSQISQQSQQHQQASQPSSQTGSSLYSTNPFSSLNLSNDPSAFSPSMEDFFRSDRPFDRARNEFIDCIQSAYRKVLTFREPLTFKSTIDWKWAAVEGGVTGLITKDPKGALIGFGVHVGLHTLADTHAYVMEAGSRSLQRSAQYYRDLETCVQDTGNKNGVWYVARDGARLNTIEFRPQLVRPMSTHIRKNWSRPYPIRPHW